MAFKISTEIELSLCPAVRVVEQIILQLMKSSKAAVVQAQEDATCTAIVANSLALDMSMTLAELMERAQLVEVVRPVQANGPNLLWGEDGRCVMGVPLGQGSSVLQG